MANKTTNSKKSTAKKKSNSPKKKSATAKKKPAQKKQRAQYSRKTVAVKNKKQGSDRKNIIMIVTSLVVIIGIVTAGILIFKDAGRKSSTAPVPETASDTAWGIDVSSHNGKINWKKASKKAEFAFIRVGYRGYSNGKIEGDKKAKYNLENAIKNGVPVGVYFYSQAITKKEAEKEAEFVLKKIKGYKVTLPVVIDFEYAYSYGKITGRLYKAKLSKKEKTALVNAFCDKVRKAGYTPGVYASSYIYRSHFNMKSIPDDVFIWVADYNKKVTYGGYYDIWQYSEKGKCQGVPSKHVDTNYFYTKKRL